MENNLILASDLDNTLLFSKKHAAPQDICVELYQGRPQGFFTPRTIELLHSIKEEIFFVPVTTRSIAQYQRITWPAGCESEYAVTTNGAVLLHNGEQDREWQERAEAVIAPWREEIARLFALYENDERFELCRIVDGAYLFVARPDATDAAEYAARCQQETELTVVASGRKIYFFPPQLSKGWAVQELRRRFGKEESKILAAGDSTIDIPMLEAADCAFVSDTDLAAKMKKAAPVRVRTEDMHFAEFVLGETLKLATTN